MSLHQDIIGQLPILKTFNHGLLGFEVADDASSSRERIVEALRAAEEKLTTSFPWLAGAVVNEGKETGNSGLYRIVPWPATATSANNIVRTKDATDLLPSFQDLVKTKAPVSVLDAGILCPYPGFPAKFQDSPENPEPVMAIQATFVRGGLLLNFSAQHNAIDASGMMQVMHLFAMAMNQESYSPSMLKNGNRDRATVVPLLAPGEAVKDHSHLLLPEDFKPRPPPPPGGPPKWAYFLFKRAAVPGIKALASQTEGYDPSVPYITSNDALSAFYWKCLASVRAHNGRPADALAGFSRAIDCRRAMGLTIEYMGHMVYHARTHMTLRALAEAPVSTIACRLRRDLDERSDAASVRSYATFIAGQPDKARVLYGGGLFDPDVDVGSSAVPNAEFFHAFGGVLGKPAFARRPNLAPIPGCVYWMPSEGEYLPVLVCLREDDLQGLRDHPDWREHAEFLG